MSSGRDWPALCKQALIGGARNSRAGRLCVHARPGLAPPPRSVLNQVPSEQLVDEQGRTNPLAALDELRRRIRTRHYSYRTECSYADWVRRTRDTDSVPGGWRQSRAARVDDLIAHGSDDRPGLTLGKAT